MLQTIRQLRAVFCVLLIILSGTAMWSCVMRQAPSPLPHVRPEFETAQFWIERMTEPDKVILAPLSIAALNQAAIDSGAAVINIFDYADEITGESLAVRFRHIREVVSRYARYDHTNFPADPAYYEALCDQFMVDTGVYLAQPPRFGIITTRVSMRELPTAELSLGEPNDYEFDYLQYSALECGMPVLILHATDDARWIYVQSYFVAGWVPAATVGIGSRDEIARFTAATAPENMPLVITGNRVYVYRDPAFTQFAAELQMGARLPERGQTSNHIMVALPVRDAQGNLAFISGYLRPDADVSVGFLPYTHGNVIRQAFKLLGDPYGWGGMYEGRDCSRFIMDVFRTFGFDLPRNSSQQARYNAARAVALRELGNDGKVEALRDYEGVPSLLYFRGHIMLYLGVVDDRAYAIHNLWAYRLSRWRGNRIMRVGETVVSELEIGAGSKRGSLLTRLQSVIPMN